MSDEPSPTSSPIPPSPFWMPDTQGFLAIAIVCLIGTIAITLLVRPPMLNETTSNVLSTVLGILLGCFKDVYSFFFGSSKGSKDASAVVAKSMEAKDSQLTTMGAALAVSAPVGAAVPPTTVTKTEVHGDPASTITTTTEPAPPDDGTHPEEPPKP